MRGIQSRSLPQLFLLFAVLVGSVPTLLGFVLPRVLLATGLDQAAIALTAFSEVGPAASICLSRGTPYEYGPTRSWHWGLLRDPPEAAVAAYFRDAVSPSGAAAADIDVERVTVNIHNPGGPTEVLTRVQWSDGREERYAVRLHSGAGSSWVSLDTPAAELMLCSRGFGRWEIDKVSSA